MKVFFDSDILIWHLRGDRRALKFFRNNRKEGGREWWIGALCRAEIVFFMRQGEEAKTWLFLSQFSTAPVDADLIDAASVFYRKYNPSHGTDINDAILAATVERHGGILFTLNVKHYPMKTIVVERAW